MSLSVFNRRWAEVILEALTRQGVRHICIAPGSRSTPLTLSAADHRKLICHTHFDERGLGHLALGLAKGSREPVAVIVTSGTAVANLYPAVIEAGITGERLILLTADRPPELIDCGANQAIRQPGIFASHPSDILNLPRPTTEIPATWLVSAVEDAMARLEQGALHINCPFAEPLYGGAPEAYADWSAELGDWWHSDESWLQTAHPRCVAKQHDWFYWRQKRGVVLAGRLEAEEGRQLAQWCALLGWPLISDIQSQTGQPLPCADLWLAHPQAESLLAEAQLVIQFGTSLTSKRLLQWQAKCQPEAYWLVAPQPGRQDSAHHRGRRLVGDISTWLLLHPPQLRAPWAEALCDLANQVQQRVTARLADSLGEAYLAHHLHELLPEHGQVFVGNSLIVRLIDALAQLPVGYPVYANRGASGIDGLIATAAGVHRAACRPTLIVLGDISALYDLNSLALLREHSAPVVIIVVNNDGGAIFSALPTPEAERRRFYQMPHGLHFEPAARMFELRYCQPGHWSELRQAIEEVWLHGGRLLVELNVAHEAGAHSLKALLSEVQAL